MESESMFSGTIFYTKEFADYERVYLERSFQACYDVGCCAAQEAGFTRILSQLQNSLQLNSGEYLNWVADFLGGIRRNGEGISARLLLFVVDLSRLNAWVEKLYQRYGFDRCIVQDIGYLDYYPNGFNEFLLRYYYYCFLLDKYSVLGKRDERVLMRDRELLLKNRLCDRITLLRVAAELGLKV